MNSVSLSSVVKGIVAVATVLVVVVVLFTGYGGLSSLMSLVSGNNQMAEIPGDFRGFLWMSVVGVATSTNDELREGVIPLLLDLANNEVLDNTLLDRIEGQAIFASQHALSASGRYGTFLGAFADVEGGGGAPSVYRAEIDSAVSVGDAVSQMQQAELVASATDEDYYRVGPVVSDRGTILYTSLSRDTYREAEGNLGTLAAEEWNIRGVSMDGETAVVTSGIRPKWVTASSFAFLKNDGIYLYNFDSATEQKVWDTGELGTMTIASGFDVSDDATLLVLSVPTAERLLILRALNWEAGSFSVLAEENVVATNLVLSPDNRYLALLTLRTTEVSAAVGIPTLEFISLSSLRYIQPSARFDPEAIIGIYATEWR